MLIQNLEHVKRIEARWEFGSEKPSIGGMVTLLTEINLIALYFEIPNVDFRVVAKRKIYSEIRETMENLIVASDIFPQIAFSRTGNMVLGLKKNTYPEHFEELPKKIAIYSTERLSAIYRLTNIKPELKIQFPNDLLNSLPITMSGYLVVNFRMSKSTQQQRNDYDKWNRVAVALNKVHNKPVFLVGDGDAKLYFDRNKEMLFKDLPLSWQLGIVQNADFACGMASGMMSACMFASTPYLIFKDPNEHADQIAREIDDNGHLPWGLDSQRIFRSHCTYDEAMVAIEHDLAAGAL